jgi:hypothetical protein
MIQVVSDTSFCCVLLSGCRRMSADLEATRCVQESTELRVCGVAVSPFWYLALHVSWSFGIPRAGRFYVPGKLDPNFVCSIL